jgi:APA family basic amino acid/polyamine antiporter
LATSNAPAADTLAAQFGAAGRTLIAAGIFLSASGFLTMTVLMSSRVYRTMARDGLFFASMSALHPRLRTPVGALVGQCVVTLALLASGTYGQLLDYVVFADWIFFGLCGVAIFVSRARERSARTVGAARGVDTPRSIVRVPLHPITTGLFIAASASVMVGSIGSNPGNAVKGSLILVAGVPAYIVWKRRAAARALRPSAL